MSSRGAALAGVLAVLLALSWAAPGLAGRAQLGELKILAIGDSITEGSVPSRGFNHPYTIQLQNILRSKFPSTNIVIDNQGVGGSGIYATGFHKPTTVVPVAQDSIASAKRVGRMYDVVVVMVGINDLLRVGKSADEVMSGLDSIYAMALDGGANVVAIPPLGAPGFVSRDDYKEGERKKLAQKIKDAAAAQNSQRSSPKMEVLDLQSGPLNFYDMDGATRSQWLDDGLHLTQHGYDQLAGYIADAVARLAGQ